MYIQTTLGPIPLLGATMTDEKERKIARAAALRDMPRWGLEAIPENLPRYFAMIREALK